MSGDVRRAGIVVGFVIGIFGFMILVTPWVGKFVDWYWNWVRYF